MNKRIDQYIAEYEELDPDNKNDENSDPDLEDEMKALMIDFSPSSLPEKDSNDAETFITTFLNQ
jgi:hypothetical protein